MNALDATALDSTARVRFAHILFPTDLSPSAERALPYALAIAQRYRAAIHAVNVITQPGMYALVPPASWPQIAKLEEEARQDFRQRIEHQLETLQHEVIFQNGEVWPVLSRIIHERKIDLIVLSTHAPLAVEKFFLGSVAEEIFRRALCPVLTVGPSAPLKPRQLGELDCILYATDFSPESLAGAPYAISLAREHRARLVLLHCRHDSEDVHALRQALHDVVPFGAELRNPPDCVVERGRPAEKILEAAEAHEADLIVLGIRGAEHISGGSQFRQSGSYQIVARSKCPVLTVRG